MTHFYSVRFYLLLILCETKQLLTYNTRTLVYQTDDINYRNGFYGSFMIIC